ncbi:MAG: hypothetical protein LRY46_03825 [Candidatus Pacebacteria bacterium]|nr:hypothetical protein [Candidatus Paceibacterota bacterium]MCD8563597.1 hypothetical protein [Candidatus Paceibacterota bacterium]
MENIIEIFKKRFDHIFIDRTVDEKFYLQKDFEKIIIDIVHHYDQGHFKITTDPRTGNEIMIISTEPEQQNGERPFDFMQSHRGVRIATPHGKVLLYNMRGKICLDINNSFEDRIWPQGSNGFLWDVEYAE